MTLSEPQALWIKDFTGRAAAKQSFDNEVALKQAIIKEVREKIAKEKIKLQEAITFEAGGRTTLDQDGSQRTNRAGAAFRLPEALDFIEHQQHGAL